MKNLAIFDFDCTLFRSPLDTSENRSLYEKATGEPWEISNRQTALEVSKRLNRNVGIRRGWYGRSETLCPPLVPDPAPQDWFIEDVVARYFQCKKCPETRTVIMTGRHRGIGQYVLRILGQGGLVVVEKHGDRWVHADPDVDVLFRGDDGPSVDYDVPKPNDDTISWKRWITEKYHFLYPDLENTEIWEDREEHVQEFEALEEILGKTVKVFHVL